MNSNTKTNKTFNIQDTCYIAVFTAVIVIMAQIAIPMPFGVPMTMQTFAITLAAIVLGAKRSAIAALVYLLIGCVGVPVFSNFSGGLQALVGPTGGFLISFPVMAYIIGYGTEKRANKAVFISCLVLGTLFNYIIGVLMFCLLTHSTVVVGFTACVLPFIPTAVIKAVLAVILGLQLRSRLSSVMSRTMG